MTTTQDLTDLPRATHIEIHEDNGGGLWLRPVGQGIVIEMPHDGDALADCRLYMDGWDAADSPEHVWDEGDILSDDPARMRHIATYRPDRDTLDVELDVGRIGHAGREYLGLDA